jgi:hypothetical protein
MNKNLFGNLAKIACDGKARPSLRAAAAELLRLRAETAGFKKQLAAIKAQPAPRRPGPFRAYAPNPFSIH